MLCRRVVEEWQKSGRKVVEKWQKSGRKVAESQYLFREVYNSGHDGLGLWKSGNVSENFL